MKKHRKQTDQQRREFLRSSIATGAGAVIATAAPAAVAVSGTTESVDKSAKPSAGYQLSQHVLDYYKTCAR
jgi:hypothetical protein